MVGSTLPVFEILTVPARLDLFGLPILFAFTSTSTLCHSTSRWL